ncbi:capsular polysaccharide synthesis protein [Celeribacter sp. PS-C1]|uniref:capsular polysaccharide synthesis protein n=1 Tax=Celeribacter sp. PS-C1 TaxID=2820813 RepID=UPI001CA5355B|nr:capsular polysaccharide synthesis protein [Celeribacter sp. PS-C1]MBW6419126.1 capsular polysaccharide synthesis protein [Celeribacter sp. PS-C1]
MTVYSMWYQGFENAPDFVKRIHCIWCRLNPDKVAHVIGGEEADELLFAEGIDPSPLTMQVRANIVRAVLLADRGGVWRDVSLIPARPLSDWLPQMLDQEAFFAFRNPGEDRILSNWFLASEAGHPLMTAWRDAYVNYFKTRRTVAREAPYWVRIKNRRRIRRDPASFASPEIAKRTKYYPYFIMHYHFDWLVKTRPDLAAAWARVPEVPAVDALKLRQSVEKHRGQLDSAVAEELLAAAPVHKIRWKKDPELYSPILSQIEQELTRRGM